VSDALFLSTAGEGSAYPRMMLPARALEAVEDVMMLYVGRDWEDVPGRSEAEACWGDNKGPSVWQLVANYATMDMMRDYREITGQPAYIEVDDNYLVDMSGYLQGVVPLANLSHDSVGVWALEDVPEDYPWVNSPGVHIKAVEEADGIIVATENLANFYREHNDNVSVCRNGVNLRDWPQLRVREDGIFRIVFAGSPTLSDLAQIREAMIWAAKQSDVEVWFIGYQHKLLRWDGVHERFWFDNVYKYHEYMAWLQPDVWLRPTDSGVFAQGKSDLKILEAAMVGALPIVTPSGEYRNWVMSGALFVSSGDKHGWTQQLRWCLENRDEVRRRAATIRNIVLNDRTMSTIKKEWSRALAIPTS
jgi:hypothetical protein